MPGPLYQYLAQDHARLGALLDQAAARSGAVERAAYADFRAGLLRHIGMEEKILLPATRRWRGGEPLPVAAQLRRDHAALAALLVPTPTPEIVHRMRSLLEAHNVLEEGPGGLYETCEALAGDEVEALVIQLRAAPDVPVAPHFDGPNVQRNVETLLAAAQRSRDAREAGEC